MTAYGWLGLAVALVLCAGPRRWAQRVPALAGRGRLSARTRRGRRTAAPWARVGTLVAVGGIVVAAYHWGGPLVAGAAFAAAATVARLLDDMAARRVRAGRARQLRTAVRILVGELEAGAAPPVALTAAATVTVHFAAVFASAADAAARGDDAAAVLLAAPDAPMRVIGHAWRLGEQTGSALAAVLDRVASDLDADAAQERSVQAALAGPRSSAALLAGLPALGIVLGSTMGARPLTFLLATAPGRVVGTVGVLLDVAGVLWLRRILQHAARAP